MERGNPTPCWIHDSISAPNPCIFYNNDLKSSTIIETNLDSNLNVGWDQVDSLMQWIGR